MNRLSLGIRIREVLDEFGSAHGDSSRVMQCEWPPSIVASAVDHPRSVEGICRGEAQKRTLGTWLSRLRDVEIRDSMEGAIETRSETSVPIATDSDYIQTNSGTLACFAPGMLCALHAIIVAPYLFVRHASICSNTHV